MEKDWSSIQISFLLYLLVILFPVNLYIANGLIDDSKNDTAAISTINTISSKMRELPYQMDDRQIKTIDNLLNALNSGFISLEENQASAGFVNPRTEFALLEKCWGKLQNDVLGIESTQEMVERSKQCWSTADKLAKGIVHITGAKRERSLDTLYLSLVFTMIVAVAMIYFIRTYMKVQLDKHTIYDLDTKLFNRDYLMAELPQLISLADRYGHDLSILSIAIDNYESVEAEVGDDMERVLEIFGGLLITLTRGSDISCRYSLDRFVIITPATNLQNAMVVANRIHAKVLEHDFGINHPMTVSISVAKHLVNESMEKWLDRGMDTLSEAKKTGNRILTSDARGL